MKTLRNWQDLSEFGIHCQTGEACGIGMRLLCDLTHGGAKLMREFLGLPYDCPLMENWNSGGVASMMLSHGVFVDLAAFCLLAAGKCKMAFHIKNEGVWGAESDEEIVETRENSGTAWGAAVQLLTEKGHEFSAPILTGEAGIYNDESGYYYYPELNK